MNDHLSVHPPSRRRGNPSLTPVPGLTPVILDRPSAAFRLQRSLLSFAVLALSLPLFQTPVFGMDRAAARLKEKCATLLASAGENGGLGTFAPGVSSTNPELFLAGHTNVPGRSVPGVNRPHTNVPHTNVPGKHVNVPSEVGHANLQRPHANSAHTNIGHTNTAHQNTPHTNITTPNKGSEKT